MFSHQFTKQSTVIWSTHCKDESQATFSQKMGIFECCITFSYSLQMIWTAPNLTTSSGCGSCQPAATPTPTSRPPSAIRWQLHQQFMHSSGSQRQRTANADDDNKDAESLNLWISDAAPRIREPLVFYFAICSYLCICKMHSADCQVPRFVIKTLPSLSGKRTDFKLQDSVKSSKRAI